MAGIEPKQRLLIHIRQTTPRPGQTRSNKRSIGEAIDKLDNKINAKSKD
jgi:hypothetical protein